MGLHEIHSGKEPERKNNTLKPVVPSDSNKNDSIMSNPNDSVRLTEEQKHSILSKDTLTSEYRSFLFGTIYRDMTGGNASFEIKNDPTSVWSETSIVTKLLFKDLLGLGISIKDIEKIEKENAEKFHNAGLDYQTLADEEKLRKFLKDNYNIEPTNKNIRNFLDQSGNREEFPTNVSKAEAQYKKEANNFGEGLADLVSGIASFFVYSCKVGQGGNLGKTSIALSLGVAGLVGGMTKCLFKFMDGGTTALYRECTGKGYADILNITGKDFITGAFSGILAPITGGIGGAVGKALAGKAGLKVAEYGTEKIIETGIKQGFGKSIRNMLTNYGGYKYSEGSKALIASVCGAEMAVDGMLGGAVDCGFRSALNGDSAEEIKTSALHGGIAGALFAPAIGGIFKKIAGSIDLDYSTMACWVARQKLRFNISASGRSAAERKVLKKQLQADFGSYKFLKNLINDKNLTADEIVRLSWHYGNDIEMNRFIEKLLYDKTLNLSKKESLEIIGEIDKENFQLIKQLLSDENIPNKYIAKLAEYANISGKNIENIKSLLSTEKLRNWCFKNIDAGNDVELIFNLSKTQKKLWQEAEKIKTPQKEIQTATKSLAEQDAEAALITLGVHPKMAPNFIKKCLKEDIIDSEKYELISTLLKVYKDKKDIPLLLKELDNIFEFTFSKELRNVKQQFVYDIMKFKKAGIDDIKLAMNLSAIKNMDSSSMTARFNTKQREDIINRINSLNLSKEIKKDLGIDEIAEKALTEPKVKKVSQKEKPAETIGRTIDDIEGAELVVLNKFKHEVPETIWKDPVKFKKWAEDKLTKIMDFNKNPNYNAVGEYSKFNKTRKVGIKNWYKYLKKESRYKDDVFVHVLFMDGITKEMRPNNAIIPPAVSHRSFEETYNALLQAGTKKVSITQLYAQKLRERAIKEFGKEKVSLNGVEGQWVTIPRTKKTSPDYEDNVAMVQALAEGSSWCLRYEPAYTYLKDGNLHFFIDKLGNAQAAIHETNGTIKQIQKRYNQDHTVPIPYAEVISKWAKKYKGYEEEIKNALSAKPVFDKLKDKLTKLMSENDFLGVFKALGITANIGGNKTYILSNYNPILDRKYTLFDLGVDENKLMQNVSAITSDVNLNGSRLTTLPNIKRIDGRFLFGDCKIEDLRSLEYVNGHGIIWDK